VVSYLTNEVGGWWDLAERSDWFASMPMVAGSNPCGGRVSTLCSDLLLAVLKRMLKSKVPDFLSDFDLLRCWIAKYINSASLLLHMF
jgi:hypothetical protein